MATPQGNRVRIVAAFAVLRDGEELFDLADYASDADRNEILSLAEQYANWPNAEFRIEQLVRQLVAAERFSSLMEVHPAWILERLREEPPRVIGIILRSLPSRHVRYILEQMPPMLRAMLPDMVESFAVSRPVLELIRRRFESHFLPMPISRTIDSLQFQHLYYLSSEHLEELIRDVGLSELAIALSGLSGKTLHVVYNRLKVKDAKRLQRRMRDMAPMSPDLFRQARQTILEADGEHVGPEKLLLQAGLSALAAAIDPNDPTLLKLIMQRLTPGDAYRLKRYVDERRLRHRETVAHERREMILAHVATLAREGRIDPSWSRYFPVEQSASASTIPEEDEETKTGSALA